MTERQGNANVLDQLLADAKERSMNFTDRKFLDDIFRLLSKTDTISPSSETDSPSEGIS
jgi:hypothetical protein